MEQMLVPFDLLPLRLTFLLQLTMLPWLIVGDRAGIFSTSWAGKLAPLLAPAAAGAAAAGAAAAELGLASAAVVITAMQQAEKGEKVRA